MKNKMNMKIEFHFQIKITSKDSDQITVKDQNR